MSDMVGMTYEDLELLAELSGGYGESIGIGDVGVGRAEKYRTGRGSLEDLQIGPGRITLFGAPPKRGKTALVTQLAFDAARLNEDIAVLVANAEMLPRDLAVRQYARLSAVPINLIEGGDMDAEAKRRVDAAIGSVRGLPVEIMRPPFDTANLACHVSSDFLQGSPGPGRWLVVVDYVQRFHAVDEIELAPWRKAAELFRDNRARKINRLNSDDMKLMDQVMKARKVIEGTPPRTNDPARVMADLRSIAMGGAAVIVVSAMSRDSYESIGLGGFRGSSELEYGADDAYLLDRDEDRPNIVHLRHVASRNSETRDRTLRFEGAIQRFTPIDEKEAPHATQSR